MSRHVVRAFTGVLERNLLWDKPVQKNVFVQMLQRIKFAQLWWENSNSPADLGAWCRLWSTMQQQPSGTTHTLEKTSIHCITFLPCRGISKPAGQKEGPVVEILPDLTSLQKAYLDKARRGRKQRVVNGSLGHPSYPQTAVCDISHYVGFWIYYLLIFGFFGFLTCSTSSPCRP